MANDQKDGSRWVLRWGERGVSSWIYWTELVFLATLGLGALVVGVTGGAWFTIVTGAALILFAIRLVHSRRSGKIKVRRRSA